MKFLAPLIAFMPAYALAVEAPESLEEAISLLPLLIEFFQAGQYLLVGAVLTLIATFGVRKYVLPTAGLGNGVLPIVASVLGLFAGWGVAVIGGAEGTAAVLTVLSGPLAITFWDSLVKYFVPKK